MNSGATWCSSHPDPVCGALCGTLRAFHLICRCVIRSSLALTLLSCTTGGRGGVGRAQRDPQQEPLVISHKCNPPPWDLCAVRLALLAQTPGPWIVIVCIEFDWKGMCTTKNYFFLLDILTK